MSTFNTDVPEVLPKRIFKARVEAGPDTADGYETHKVTLAYLGGDVAEITIKLMPISSGIAVIQESAKFYAQHPALRSVFCLLAMEAFLHIHPVAFSGKPEMFYGEELLREVSGSISLVCEKHDEVPGAYYAMDREHRVLIDAAYHHGYTYEPA